MLVMREDDEMTDAHPWHPGCRMTEEVEHARVEVVEHEVTSFADLARGARVFLLPDGTTREEPIE